MSPHSSAAVAPPPCICCGAALVADPRITARLEITVPPGYRPAVWRCPFCSYRRLWPALSEPDYEQVYSRDYFSAEAGDAAGADYDASRADRMRFYDERLARIRALRPGRLRVLDVGAAEGDFLSRCDPAWDRLGIEYSQHGVDAARGRYGLELRKGPASAIVALGGGLDVVHLHHVFEHLVDPSAFLRQAREALVEGGLLACEVPYQFAALTEVLRAALGRPLRMRGLWAVHHPHFFTPRALDRLLRAHGFARVSLTTCPASRRRLVGDGLLKAALRWPLFIAQRLTGRGPVIEAIYRRAATARLR